MRAPGGVLSGTYEPNKRVMLKVKHERDCDCVVAGFRWYRKAEHPAVGSLLLGLFDDSGALQHVGVCGSFTKFAYTSTRDPRCSNVCPSRAPTGDGRGAAG